MARRIVGASLCGVVFAALVAGANAQGQRLPDVIYMDQPTGIALAQYRAAWPALSPYVTRIEAGQAGAVAADLHRRATMADVSDGELNLLAQLAWLRGDLDEADAAAAKAVALRPNQPLDAFQFAMVNFAHLRRATGIFEPWQWQRRTRDAYQRVFDLDPANVSARYYLAYSYMNTPSIAGGDLDKALELSNGGIALGQNGFYAVRADAHRLRGETDAAAADYDTSIKLKTIKLGGLLDAAQDELARKDFARAKRYLDWAAHCRPDSSKTQEGLGDYFLAMGNRDAARQSYKTALEKDPANEAARQKLAAVS